MTWDETFPLIAAGFAVLLFIFIIYYPRSIDEVRNDKNKLLFTIYQSGFRFIVHDYRTLFKRRIVFKTYVDVEAFIQRRVNGWKDIYR